jgi:hypothetical protein
VDLGNYHDDAILNVRERHHIISMMASMIHGMDVYVYVRADEVYLNLYGSIGGYRLLAAILLKVFMNSIDSTIVKMFSFQPVESFR